MRIVLAGLVLLALTSCGMSNSSTWTNSSTGAVPTSQTGTIDSPNANASTSGTTEQTQSGKVVPTQIGDGSLVSVNYTLHTDSPTGPVFDTNIQAVAEANGKYNSGARYEPLSFMMGAGQMIPGFEKGIIGMKKWEKKVIIVSPDQWYGTSATLRTIKYTDIAPKFTLTKEREIFADTVIRTVAKKDIPAEYQNAKIGDTVTGVDGVSGKVTAITSTGMTIAIDNSNNPFYKKPLKVGLTSESDNYLAKVISLTDKNVTIELTNKESPFYNKKFAVGESFTIPGRDKIIIKSIDQDKDMATIAVEHPLMGKTLYFDVEVTDIQ